MKDTYCAVGNYIYENKDFPSAVVEDIKLKVTLTEAEIRPLNTGGNSITNAKIKITNGSQPLTNKKVKITVNRIERSGGHDHSNSPDLNLWGRITVQGNKGNPVTATTNQNGEINTDEILASEFGGEYYVEASLESNPSVKDKANLTLRVPNLVPLETSPYYELIGSPNNYKGTNDPCRQEPPASKHYLNHYVLDDKKYLIKSIAQRYNSHYSNQRLRINDISLEYGGKFDINSDWNINGDHKFHKIGLDVDIGFTGIDLNNMCVKEEDMNRDRIKKIIFSITKKMPYMHLGAQPHFHVYL